jgi:hypothetical protein
MVVIGSFVWENKEWKPPPRWKLFKTRCRGFNFFFEDLQSVDEMETHAHRILTSNSLWFNRYKNGNHDAWEEKDKIVYIVVFFILLCPSCHFCIYLTTMNLKFKFCVCLTPSHLHPRKSSIFFQNL